MPRAKKQSGFVIKLSNVTKEYGHEDTLMHALNGIDLEIEKGEFVAIMGPSGCGKTTLLNILGLLDSPSDGDYELSGQPVDTLSPRRQAHIRSHEIGFVFQSFNLLPRMTIIDNVALPLSYTRMPRYKQHKNASRMLKTFDLQEREYYMPTQLSGGQLQRVAIARALVNKPSIILADEPTGNLDSRASELIMNELSDIHRRGNTIVMVTHNPDLTTYATRIIHMLDGRIARDTKKPEPTAEPGAKRPLNRAAVSKSKKGTKK